jgi:WXXGXW repeat (2 copies)
MAIGRTSQFFGNTQRTPEKVRIMRIARLIGSLLLAVGLLAIPAQPKAQVALGISVRIGPPPLPVYAQPICPGPDFIWIPGYWAYGPDGYFWVPGTWVEPPEIGVLWTPGYWEWVDDAYVWHAGYWGPVVGFYGGINYGFGYFGHGFVGGHWDHGHFFYNRAVANINVNIIHNTYETRINNVTVTRVSYNGGNGGIAARATAEEVAAARERHVGPVAAQVEHEQAARSNRELRASVNHGKPPVAATARPDELRGGGVVAAREGDTVHSANERSENNAARPNNPIHAKDLPHAEHMAPPNSGDAKLDQKYQKQQDKLAAQQEKERQQLQKQQEKEDQKLDKQRANDAKRQQTEQRHQQQTQQMVQRHTQQRQDLQQRQQPHPAPRPARPH